jgi:peptidoglycan/LPS O-acetylase OafA/YrhL
VTARPATVSVQAARLPLDEHRARGRQVRLATWPLGAALGVAAFFLVARDGDLADPWATATLTLAIGWCFLASGLAVWAREKENPLGVLMAALGLVWLTGAAAGEFGSASASWLGFVAVNGAVAMFVHALVAFPSGRLASRRERVLVGAAYADLALLAPLWLVAHGDAPPRDGTAGLLRPETFASSLGGPAGSSAARGNSCAGPYCIEPRTRPSPS